MIKRNREDPLEDQVTRFVCERASLQPKILRVLLYGSRARGVATERSDYDFAVESLGMDFEEWSAWSLATREEAPTLLKLDLILLSKQTSPALRSQIEEDGVCIYAKN